MAKKKNKKDAKADKAAKASRAPKEIAGVKIPKPLREPAAKLLKAIQNPVVADVAAAALLAAAAALRENKSGGAAAPSAGRGKTSAGTIGAIIATKAVDTIGKLAADGGDGAGRGKAKGRKSS